jgi:hypothetical protein
MKLRQKLAAVLAATMVITAVPVTTMAATASVNTVSAVKGNTLGFTTSDSAIILDQANQVDLFMKLSQREQDLVADQRNHIFYVEAKDAEFSEAAIEAAKEAGKFQGATVKYLSKSEIEVTLTGAENVVIPLYVTVKAGEPRVIVDGTNSVVDSQTLSLTGREIGDKAFKATAASKIIGVTGGEVGAITIEELVLGGFAKDNTFKVELPTSTAVVFEGTTQNLTLNGTRGLAGVKNEAVVAEVSEDGKTLTVTVDAQSAASTGSIKIEGIKVVSDSRRVDLATQDIEVTVKGDKIADTKLQVAQVKEADVLLNVKEVKELVAGRGTKEVVLTLEGTTPESLESQLLYFTADNANIVKVTLGDVENITAVETLVDSDEFELNLSAPSATKAASVEVKVELAADIDATGDVNIKVEGRRLDTLEVKVAEVVQAVTIKSETAKLQPGVSKQNGGSITITEAEAGNLGRGEITLSISSRYGVYFTDKDLDIKTTGTLAVKVKEIDKEHQTITLEVTRTSKEAAELTISGFAFDVDATVPTGAMKLEVGGSALTQNDDVITLANFIQVGKDAAQTVTTSTFKIGEATYTVNGETKAMDAAPYVSAKNRTMMPVRYVAEAVGIQGNDIMFSNVNGGTITILAGNRIVQLQNNSNVAKLNGTDIYLDEAVTIKDGRTYVPVGEIARLLGVSVEWDNDTKTATFASN